MPTSIAWTDETWNPVTGCTKVSPACKHCYASELHDMRHRAYLNGKLQMCPQYARPFSEVQFLAHRMSDPIRWRKPRRIFVCSMSDLFHPDVTDAQIRDVLAVAAEAKRHTFQLLTKRPERLAQFSYAPNIWAGTTVEDQTAADARTPLLRGVGAAVRFLSCEPLLEPLALDLAGISWVIVGGEATKPYSRARPMDPDWARDIRDQCAAAGVAFFMKQMTNDGPIPDDLRIRQYPAGARP